MVKPKSNQDRVETKSPIPVQGSKPEALSEEKRTVIMGKRKITATSREDSDFPAARESERATPAREKPGNTYPDESSSFFDDDGMSVEIRDRTFQAKDEVFEGRGVRKPSVPQARDSTLLHTELRSKKKASERDDSDDEDARAEHAGKDMASLQKRTRSE